MALTHKWNFLFSPLFVWNPYPEEHNLLSWLKNKILPLTQLKEHCSFLIKLPWHSPRCTGTGHWGGTPYGYFLACPLAYNTAEVKCTLIVFKPILRAPLTSKMYLWNMFFDLPTWMPFTRIVATVSSPSKTRRICLFDVVSLETVGKHRVIIYINWLSLFQTYSYYKFKRLCLHKTVTTTTTTTILIFLVIVHIHCC